MPRKYDYTKVDTLPANALKVKEYANQRNCSTSLLYHEVQRGKAEFKIIQFQGINFVIPL